MRTVRSGLAFCRPRTTDVNVGQVNKNDITVRIVQAVFAGCFALCMCQAHAEKEEEKFGLDNNKTIEEKMATWLAHPAEFGVQPKSVRFKRTYKANLIGYGEVEIHLVEYEMPDHSKGRGFVNGGLTWSFLGAAVNAINDEDLFIAYCGWAWLFPALRRGTVQTKFTSNGEEAKYIARKQQEGLTDIQVTNRYKIGTSELIEFKAQRRGAAVQGAGDTTGEVQYPVTDARFVLPSIYFLLGRQVIQSVK